ncbi:8-oxo-dGTP diphosphatase [Mycoplasmatota bacterium]|nr:8-oxo-dGTP diphosphatase [Mycoplasmatota bacterium]
MTYQQKKEFVKILLIILFASLVFFSLLRFWYLLLVSIILILLLSYYYFKIDKIRETTLCLIVKNQHVLMMLRNKKKDDVHINKYNGLGGKVEKGESKYNCVLREVYEEAGIKLTKYNYVGQVVFKNFGYEVGKEVMYCFVGYDYENEIGDCNEGELSWIPKDKVMALPLWEGDQYFLMNIIMNKPFSAYLHYEEDKVIDYKIIYK